MLEKMQGIVMKTQDYGETHKIVTIFSDQAGKISGIARGAKKPKSRMAAITQPFIYGDFFVYLHSGLSTLQQGDVIYSFRSIREDIIKTAYASYVVELTDKLTDSHSPDHFLFNQLYQTLDWIAEHADVAVPIMMYELKLFKTGGFAPSVDKCVHCGGNDTPFAFSITEGGLLCAKCKHYDLQSITLSDNLARLFYIFSEIGLERVGTISIKPDNQKLLRDIIDAYYDQYGGYYLKSKRFLKQLDKLE
ncbi:DNA replication and repair protein RecO [Lentibacillus halodurans]|uniref:DNA repair protein RecO n=1 Tax=Lentibacillus halodurans TaxID=237679 RepID=A0A1I0V352_9BACI|nr:DNA repair protein RecO [Lentibacillus halodurans]SFA70467.1 DNA replication and repair protein RecO [Lentibacillus halodurans]